MLCNCRNDTFLQDSASALRVGRREQRVEVGIEVGIEVGGGVKGFGRAEVVLEGRSIAVFHYNPVSKRLGYNKYITGQWQLFCSAKSVLPP